MIKTMITKPMSETPKAIYDRLYELRIPEYDFNPETKEYTKRDPGYEEVVSRYHFIVVRGEKEDIIYYTDSEKSRVREYLNTPRWGIGRLSLPDAVINNEDGKGKVIKNRYGYDQLPREETRTKVEIPGLNTWD